ncbi:MAG: hypothetical protein ABFD77_02470 [Thermotogota bacterium]
MKKIKTGKKGKPRVRGFRATAAMDSWKRGETRRVLQDQARRRRMTRKDSATGEEYVLARLALVSKEEVEDYRKGLAECIDGIDGAEGQSEAIRAYLQSLVEQKRLAPIPCAPKEKPTCRVYSSTPRRVVVIRQDDPELKGPR